LVAIFASWFFHISLASGDDFRKAIETNGPRIVLIRSSIDGDPSAEFLIQQGFTVGPKWIATIDRDPDAADRIWESYDSGSGWTKVETAGKDLVSGYLVLRMAETTESLVSETPSLESLQRGPLELGLPTVVLWNESGALHVKTAILSSLGNPMNRTPPSLDVELSPRQLGAPVLDADGRLLGLVGYRDSRFGTRTARDLMTKTQAETTDVIASARILENLISKIRAQSEPPELDLGFLGVRLGNGDATIRSVIAGSAADRQQITSGSRIVGMNGAVTNVDDQVVKAISYLRAGDSIRLTLETKDEGGTETTRDVDVTLRGLRTRRMIKQEPTAILQLPTRSQLEAPVTMQELRQQIETLRSEIASLKRQLQDLSDNGK
jgi:S1-C subfamily serine protease